MKHFLTSLYAVVMVFTTLGSVQAVPLSTLFAGGSLTSGDKLFDQFTLNFAGTSDGRVINTGNIDVTTLGPVGPNPLDPGRGLRFSVLNDELKVRGDGTFAYADLQFGFHVSVLDPNFRLKDNSLVISDGLLSRAADGNNDLGAYILETIGTMSGSNDLGVSAVEFGVLDDVFTANLSAAAIFAPQRDIWVTKNILVWSQDATDTASLDAFEQRFSQAQAVPEPGVLALLGIAGLVACLVRRRDSRGG